MSKDKSLFLLLSFVFIVFGSFLEACRENQSCFCHLSSAPVLAHERAVIVARTDAPGVLSHLDLSAAPVVAHESPVIVPRTAVVAPSVLDLAALGSEDAGRWLLARVVNLELATAEQLASSREQLASSREQLALSREQNALLTKFLSRLPSLDPAKSCAAAATSSVIPLRPPRLSRRSSVSSILSAASSQGIDSVPEGLPGSEDDSDSDDGSAGHPSSGGHSAGSKTPEGATAQQLTPTVEVYRDGRPSCLGLSVVDLEEPVYGASAGAGDGRVYDLPASPTGASGVRRVVPSSPQPTYRDEVPDPGIFKKLYEGSFNPTVLFNYDGLFCFVGLMSNTYQASVSKKVEWGFDSSYNPVEAARAVSEELSGGASVDAAVKFALQLTCATDPANVANNKTQWARVDSTIKDKGEFLFVLLEFLMIKFGILPPDQNTYGTRTWHNAGAPFQTVKWPHLNWTANRSLLSLVEMKNRLKEVHPSIATVPFFVVAEELYKYLKTSFGLECLKSEDAEFLNAQWPEFKKVHAELFPVRAE